MRTEITWWLDAARRDLSMALQLQDGGFYEGVAFHSQQSAEKFLKALLIARGGRWTRTHSCVAILRTLADTGLRIPPEIITMARKLDLHYIDARYPNGVGGPPAEFYDATIAREAKEACRGLEQFVLTHLGEGLPQEREGGQP